MSISSAGGDANYYGRSQFELHQRHAMAQTAASPGSNDVMAVNKDKADHSMAAIASMLHQLNSMIDELSSRMSTLGKNASPKISVVPNTSQGVLHADNSINEGRVLEHATLNVDVRSDNEQALHHKFIRGTAANTGVKPIDIWGAFTQGGTGNCVTVSAIKAAMAKFGHNPHGIYKKITEVADGFEVVMRDNFKLKISFEELEEVQEGAGLIRGSSDDVLINAQFLYAVSAKRAELEDNDEIAGDGFEDAMISLADGEYPGEALIRLGLRAHMAPTNVKELATGSVGVISNGMHQMVVVGGVVDLWGNKVRLSKDFHWRQGAKLI